MNRDEINNAYFTWLYDLVCGDRYSSQISYRKLLMHLHRTEFVYQIPKDENRASDGTKLRYRFSRSGAIDEPVNYILDCLDGPCSVFEMMVALANRCEREYMDNPLLGDRTGEWFWSMVTNLGLGSMTDRTYDKGYVDDVVTRFLRRKYDPDGKGGLFRVRNCTKDLRKVEIWYQLCYFLDEIT